ncbi:MAG: hypothetical protein SynsKO_02350 [Synoicihabitans sp.]
MSLRLQIITPLLFPLGLFAHEGAHTAGSARPALDGQVEMHTSATNRTLTGQSLPDHSHGIFPNASNPNRIVPWAESLSVPLHPQVASRLTPVTGGGFGIAINGIPFEPNAAEFWRDDRNSGWQYEALGHHVDLGMDRNHAHVQPSGKYHYHGVPQGLIDRLGGAGKFFLLGYAADGFPVYSQWSYEDPADPSSPIRALQSSYRIKSGSRPDGPGGKYDGTFVQDYEYIEGLGDLDRANGRTGVTPEYPDGTYYYVITSTFPFIPRFWRGEPAADFSTRRGGGGGGGGNRGGNNRTAPTRNQNALATLLAQEEFVDRVQIPHDTLETLSRRLRQVQRQLQPRRPRNSDEDPEVIRAQRQEQRQALADRILEVRAALLTPEEDQRLQQGINRAQGTEFLLTAFDTGQLTLSEEQYSQLYALIIQARAAFALSLEWSDVVSYLDKKQRGQLQELIGAIE